VSPSTTLPTGPSTTLATGAPAAVGRDFLTLSRRFLDALGADGLGDESDQRQFAVDGTEPSWVLLPASASDAETALRICAEQDLAVVPAGRGLRLGHGMPAQRLDVVLSTSAMNAIVEHAAADLTLTVEAGATLAAVNEALRPAGQWLPFDPPLAAETTIGGLVAGNVAGPSRQAFATVRESLLGVRALLADGTPVKSGGRVVKNVAGYDVHKLLVGSFGTLAVLVAATFKLQPLPESRRFVCFRASDVGPLVTLACRIADSASGAQMLELLADAAGESTLVAVFAGTTEDVDAASHRAGDLGMAGFADSIDDAQLSARLEAFARVPATSVVFRVAVPRADLGAWLSASRALCNAVAGGVRAHAHAALGIARLRLDDADAERIAPVVAELRESARRRGGYLVVEHAPVAWKRQVDVWGPPPAAHDLMKGIKAAFDPRGLLSPGRFVGGL
jgi:glycolate oxidase FAD binding subunit